VFLPTYGSWLNWIEAEFAGLRYVALNGTDHRSRAEQNAAIVGYVRWHNTRASPKVTDPNLDRLPSQGRVTSRRARRRCRAVDRSFS
jgi:transposase